jgi:steroid delta-isomerase-like uncharacterized protein
MSLEERKAICRWGYLELWNEGNFDVIEEAVSEDVVAHDIVHGELHGPDEIREVIAAFREAFPDLEMTIEDQVGEGDFVVTRYSITGTHSGELDGMPPTGKRLTITGVNVARWSDIRIVEAWETWDALAFVQGLGLPRRWRGFPLASRTLQARK